MSQENQRPPRSLWQTAWLLVALVLGLGAFLFTMTASMCSLSLVLIQRQRFLPSVTLPIFSLIAAGGGLGLPLAWQAITGLCGKPSRRFAPSSAWGLALILLYLLALVFGQASLSLRLAPTLTLPPFHVMALALPPLIYLWGTAALAKEPQFTWRQFLGGLGGGAFGSLMLAFLIEMTLLVIGIVVASVVLAATMAPTEMLHRLRPTPGGLNADQAFVRSLLRNPAVIITLLVSLSLIVPVIEEVAKSLVPALAGALQRPSVAPAFLWGVASGAGFAVVEGMLNGGLSVEQWAAVAMLRLGSSAMHCLTAGLTGWGWGKVWAQRKWLHLLLAYALAVVVHGVWNAGSIGMGLAEAAFDQGMLQNMLAAASVGLLVLLTIGMIAALMILAKRFSVSEHPQAMVEGGAT